MNEVPKVYAAISAVQAALSKHGISKDRKNQQQGYSFRGIDDVLWTLAPLLAEHQLLIIPRTISRQVTERETKAGGALFYVTVDMEFDFISAVDGSKHTGRMVGEAMDSADKASNKAQSAGYKYMCLQAFCIPTESTDNDADYVTHPTVAPKTEAKPAPAPAKAPASTPAPKPTPTPAPAAKTAPAPAKAAPTQIVEKVPSAAKQAANAPAPAVSDWRQEIIHFGKRQGVPLGELAEDSLVWFITKWDPNGKAGITPSAADIRLRKALNLAGASMALPGFGEPPQDVDYGDNDQYPDPGL